MSIGAAYLGSFRSLIPEGGFKVAQDGLLSDVGVQYLGQVPRDNAAAQMAAFTATIPEVGALKRQQMINEFTEKRDKYTNKGSRAVNLARAFQSVGSLGGGGGSFDVGSLMAMVNKANPALDPMNFANSAMQYGVNSNAGIADSSRRSSELAQRIIRANGG